MKQKTLLATVVDPDAPGINNQYGTPRHEFDDVLMAIEHFYMSHERKNEFIGHDLLQYASVYLEDYLSGGVEVGERIPHKAQKELKTFSTEHRDSVFWNEVNNAVKEYEANDWVRQDIDVDLDEESSELLNNAE